MTETRLLVANGPGLAEPTGDVTLQRIHESCSALCEALGVGLDFRQTDDVDELSRWLVTGQSEFDAIIINPVAPTLAPTTDLKKCHIAMAALQKPAVEVHLVNIFDSAAPARKPLPGQDGSLGFVCGLGIDGYLLAIKAMTRKLSS